MRESQFQARLIVEIQELLPGSVVLKNDPNYRQGFPDLLVLYRGMWAALEVKVSPTSTHQPNQDYWIDYLDGMSFAAFIDPENKETVLHGIQQAFRSGR